jgi:hypothetical protein
VHLLEEALLISLTYHLLIFTHYSHELSIGSPIHLMVYHDTFIVDQSAGSFATLSQVVADTLQNDKAEKEGARVTIGGERVLEPDGIRTGYNP